MSRLEELQEELTLLRTTYKNILEGGQEFQTRAGRVKQANLSDVKAQINAVMAEIAEINSTANGTTDTIRLKWGGVG